MAQELVIRKFRQLYEKMQDLVECRIKEGLNRDQLVTDKEIHVPKMLWFWKTVRNIYAENHLKE